MAMPQIKNEVNKESEKDKKKGGFFARLFGGGGSGSGLGGAGFGESGGLFGGGGLFGSGGLLATKAGLLALILAGTTVAGGIGVLGYRLFGPGQDQGNGDNLQLFAQKPKENPNAGGQGASKDGSSASLDYLAKANQGLNGADASGEAPKDVVAANGAAGAAAKAAADAAMNAPINKAGTADNGVNKGMMKNSAKFGSLGGSSGGGGGGGSVANASNGLKLGDALAHKGDLSGMKGGNGVSVAGGTGRAIAGRKIGGAFGQALGARANGQTGTSMASAGKTFDGAAGGTGANIGGGTPISGGGGGIGSSPAQAQNLPNAAGPSNDPTTTPPTPSTTNAAPWAQQLQTAEILLGIAVACLAVCYFINKPPTVASVWISRILGGIVCMLGAMIIGIGAHIASAYGQKQFGIMGLGVGGLLIALGVNSIFTPSPTVDTVGASGGASAASGTASGMSGAASSAAPTAASLASGAVPK